MDALKELRQLKIVDDDQQQQRCDLEETLQNNEFYFKKWIPASVDLSTLDLIAVEIALERSVNSTFRKSESEKILPRTAEEVEAFVFNHIDGFKVLGLKLVQGFLAVDQLGGDCWAKIATADVDAGIGLVKKFVASGDVDKDYLSGIAYLGRWIRLQILLREGKLPLGEEYNAEEEYESLPNKGKAIVLATKGLFLWTINRKGEDDGEILKVDAIRQAVEYDQKNFLWHLLLGNWLQRKRDSCGRTSCYPTPLSRKGPSEEELQVIWETCEETDYPQTQDDDPTKLSEIRALILTQLCRILAQVLRARPSYPVKAGNLLFSSDIELVTFIKDTVRRLMSDKDTRMYSTLLYSADILANLLPHEYKQFDDAEEYYKDALTLVDSDSSRVHHKLGLLYVISTKHHDLEKAIVHLREAVEIDNFNFPGTMDFVNTLLSHPEKHRAELENIFESREISFFSSAHYSQFHFAEGAFRFLIGDQEQAVKIWIEANKAFYSNDVFHGLVKTQVRHYWTKLIEFKDVRQSLLDYFAKFGENIDEKERTLLHDLLDNVHTMKERKQKGQVNGKRERFVSEADADGDWRHSEQVSLTIEPTKVDICIPPSSSPSQKNGVYVPPARRNGQSAFSNNYKKHRTPEHLGYARVARPPKYSQSVSLSDCDLHWRRED